MSGFTLKLFEKIFNYKKLWHLYLLVFSFKLFIYYPIFITTIIKILLRFFIYLTIFLERQPLNANNQVSLCLELRKSKYAAEGGLCHHQCRGSRKNILRSWKINISNSWSLDNGNMSCQLVPVWVLEVRTTRFE